VSCQASANIIKLEKKKSKIHNNDLKIAQVTSLDAQLKMDKIDTNFIKSTIFLSELLRFFSSGQF